MVSHAGTCDEGVTAVYKAADKTEDGVKYLVSTEVKGEAGQHTYNNVEFNWDAAAIKDEAGNITGYETEQKEGSAVTVGKLKCSVCGAVEKDATVSVAKDTEASKAPTCEETGKDVYVATVTKKDADGKDVELAKDTKEVETAKLGHKYGEPTWTWADDHKSATATFTCANDSNHVEKKEAKVEEKPEGATCTKAGKVTYTATVEFNGKKYEATDTTEVAALGHDYKVTWKWAKDNSSAKATFECTRGDKKEIVDATVEKTEEDGQFVYTATATYDGKTEKDIKKSTPSVYYKVHRQTYGWESEWKSDGAESGTTGESKRLEAIKIKLPDGMSGSVQYRTHIQSIGWESEWKSDGALSGTSGKSKRLEAIQIKLTGKIKDNYDIYYCVHAQHFGWLGWAKNGEQAGTAGYAYRLEAIKIKLVPKGEKAPEKVGSMDTAMEARLVGYQTHVQSIGTQDFVYDGAMAGTSGQSLRMESLRIKLPSTTSSEGKILYKSHIQKIGWEQNWKQTGALSGTTGRSLRLEAIQIKLSGDIAKKYDVYYRVHAQKFGWLGWAKNGEKSGTEGYAYRLEGLQIKLVPKGTENPELPGPASARTETFIKK